MSLLPLILPRDGMGRHKTSNVYLGSRYTEGKTHVVVIVMENKTENNIASIVETLLDRMEGFLAMKQDVTVNISATTSVYEDFQRLKLWNAYLLRKSSTAFETIESKDASLYSTLIISTMPYPLLMALSHFVVMKWSLRRLMRSS